MPRLLSSSHPVHEPDPDHIFLGLMAAAANVFGGAIIVQRHWERRYLRYFVALGAGFMLATALVEMVPESLELRGNPQRFLVLLGYFMIHFFEHTVTPHFHFGEETHQMNSSTRTRDTRFCWGWSFTLSLTVSRSRQDFWFRTGPGVADFPAHLSAQDSRGLHVSSVMLASGRSRGTAWGASVVLGGSTLAGVLTMALFRHHVGAGLPLAAGVTIYVAASDLIPEVNKEPAVRMALLVFVGAGVFLMLDHLFRMP